MSCSGWNLIPGSPGYGRPVFMRECFDTCGRQMTQYADENKQLMHDSVYENGFGQPCSAPKAPLVDLPVFTPSFSGAPAFVSPPAQSRGLPAGCVLYGMRRGRRVLLCPGKHGRMVKRLDRLGGLGDLGYVDRDGCNKDNPYSYTRFCHDACGRQQVQKLQGGAGTYQWQADNKDPGSSPDYNKPCSNNSDLPGANVGNNTIPSGAKYCDRSEDGQHYYRTCMDNCGRAWKQIWSESSFGSNSWADVRKASDWGEPCPATGVPLPSGAPGVVGQTGVVGPAGGGMPSEGPPAPPQPKGNWSCGGAIPGKSRGSWTRDCTNSSTGRMVQQKIKLNKKKGFILSPSNDQLRLQKKYLTGLDATIPESSSIEPFIWLGLTGALLYAVTRKERK